MAKDEKQAVFFFQNDNNRRGSEDSVKDALERFSSIPSPDVFAFHYSSNEMAYEIFTAFFERENLNLSEQNFKKLSKVYLGYTVVDEIIVEMIISMIPNVEYPVNALKELLDYYCLSLISSESAKMFEFVELKDGVDAASLTLWYDFIDTVVNRVTIRIKEISAENFDFEESDEDEEEEELSEDEAKEAFKILENNFCAENALRSYYSYNKEFDKIYKSIDLVRDKIKAAEYNARFYDIVEGTE